MIKFDQNLENLIQFQYLYRYVYISIYFEYGNKSSSLEYHQRPPFIGDPNNHLIGTPAPPLTPIFIRDQKLVIRDPIFLPENPSFLLEIPDFHWRPSAFLPRPHIFIGEPKFLIGVLKLFIKEKLWMLKNGSCKTF